MTDPEANPWTTLHSREAYANPWIRVRHDEVLTPAGTPGIYGVVEYRNHAVGVVPVDDEGHTWLVGQWRYCHGRYEWEIPEGGCPPGESTAECARRELLEETGLEAAVIEPLLRGLQLSNSTTNEVCDLFIARGLTQAQACPEETEQLQVRRLPLAEAVAMARDGRLRDAVSVLALLAVADRLARGA
jgi:8-oxo-dGTP pyrophosphatase MutT (NUDIX family)